jgi:hypothetical protein
MDTIEFVNLVRAVDLFGVGYLTDVGVDNFTDSDGSASLRGVSVIVSASTVRNFLWDRIRETGKEITTGFHLEDIEMFGRFTQELVDNIRALDNASPSVNFILFQ